MCSTVIFLSHIRLRGLLRMIVLLLGLLLGLPVVGVRIRSEGALWAARHAGARRHPPAADDQKRDHSANHHDRHDHADGDAASAPARS